MNSKVKLIIGMFLTVALVCVTAFFIYQEISDSDVAPEKENPFTKENEISSKLYLAPMAVSEMIQEAESLPVTVMIPGLYQDVLNAGKNLQEVKNETTEADETRSEEETESGETVKDGDVETEGEPEEEPDAESEPESESEPETDPIPENVYRPETESEDETPEAGPVQPIENADPFAGLFVVNTEVKNYLNVREVPGGKVIGVMYPGYGGSIISVDGDWAYIQSGDVTGYVNKNYISAGLEGILSVSATVIATVQTDYLCLRVKPDADSTLMDYLVRGEEYPVHGIENGWIYTNNRGMWGYISAGFVSLRLDLPTALPMTTELMNQIKGVTPETEAAVEVPETTPAPVAFQPALPVVVPETIPAATPAAVPATVATTPAPVTEPVTEPVTTVPETEPAPETFPETPAEVEMQPATEPETEAPTEPEPTTPATTPAAELSLDDQIRQQIDAYAALGLSSREPVYVSADELYLMACIVNLEAGYVSQDGMLAVANVIVTRLKSGYWGNTVQGVIYAPYQFYPEGHPTLVNMMQKGPLQVCYEAALKACAGINNIGNYMYFCSARVAYKYNFESCVNIGGNVFYLKKIK